MAEISNFIPKIVNLVSPEHNDVFVENVLKCFIEQELLDLVFICDKNIKLFAHKLVFASVSQFLSNIINVNGKDVVYISLPDVDHNKLRILINFLYEGVTKVNVEEMLILKEIMSLLGVELQNAEIRCANSLANVTPFMFMNNIKRELDPVIGEDIIQDLQVPCDPPDLIPFVGDVRTVAEDNTDSTVTHTNTVEKENEEISNVEDVMDVDDEMDNGENVDVNMEDNNDREVIDLENEEAAHELIDIASDDDPDIYVENVVNDCEVIMEKTPSRGRATFFRRKDKKTSASLNTANLAISPAAVDNEKCDQESNVNIPESAQLTSNVSDSVQCQQSKRKGFRLSSKKKEMLEKEYKKDKIFTKKRISELAKELNITRDTVSLWYKSKEFKDSQYYKKKLGLTDEQEEVLESVYEKNRFITNEQQVALAKQLELPSETVCTWFSYKQKNKSSDIEEDSQHSQVEKDYSRSDNKQKESSESANGKTKLPVKEKQDMKNHSSLKEQKRRRFIFTDEQRQVLENQYMQNKLVNRKQQMALAKRLGAPLKSIVTWFQCRRRNDLDKGSVNNGKLAKHSHFSQEQKDILESHYKYGNYENNDVVMKLSQQLGVRSIKIKYWFYSRQLKEEYETLSLSGDVKKSLDQLNEEQKIILDSAYEEKKFLSEKDHESLAEQLSISSNVVKYFFVSKWIKNETVPLEAEKNTELTVDQKNFLLAAYDNDKHPYVETEKNVAQRLGLSHSYVSHWFNTKRIEDGIGGTEPVRSQPFTTEQKALLERSYKNNPSLSREEKQRLASQLNCSCERVRLWFSNRRSKDRRASAGRKSRGSKDKSDSMEEMSEGARKSNKSSRSMSEINTNISSMNTEELAKDLPDMDNDEEEERLFPICHVDLPVFPICHVDLPDVSYDQNFETESVEVTVKQEKPEEVSDTNCTTSKIHTPEENEEM